jgi:hypothetical protein
VDFLEFIFFLLDPFGDLLMAQLAKGLVALGEVLKAALIQLFR